MEDRLAASQPVENLAGTMWKENILLGVSIALGVLADYLMRGQLWGANVAVGLAPFLCAVLWLHKSGERPLARGGTLVLWLAFAAALLCFWRASPALMALNILFFLGSLLFAVSVPTGGSLFKAGVGDLVRAAAVIGFNALTGLLFLLGGDRARRGSPKGSSRLMPRLLQGGLLAVPPLLIFGSLFMSADPVFDHAVRSVVDIDFGLAVGHLVASLAVAWIVAGFLRGRFLAPSDPPVVKARPLNIRLAFPAVAVLLGSLILLFAGFVLFQLRYLYGGASLVEAVPGLTYAQYARQGFFELAATGALLLPLLLLTDWLFVPEADRERTVFRVLMLLLVVLLCAILASALQRMLLYQQEYGLTEQRVYVTAVIGGITLLLFLFVGTMLRGKREIFLFGGLAAVFLVLLVLTALNPADLVVRTNLARAREGKKFDLVYHARLGDDAVPGLLEGMSSLPEADRRKLLHELTTRHQSRVEAGWRGWTIGQAAASAALEAYQRDTAPYGSSTQP